MNSSRTSSSMQAHFFFSSGNTRTNHRFPCELVKPWGPGTGSTVDAGINIHDIIHASAPPRPCSCVLMTSVVLITNTHTLELVQYCIAGHFQGFIFHEFALLSMPD